MARGAASGKQCCGAFAKVLAPINKIPVSAESACVQGYRRDTESRARRSSRIARD